MKLTFPAPSRAAAVVAALLLAAGVGCSADRPLNPSFPLTLSDSRQALEEMRDDPHTFDRPVVLVGGFFDTGVFSAKTARVLESLTTNPNQVIVFTPHRYSTFESCRTRLVQFVDEHFPCDDEGQTTEVDVVAVSMGGLVARYAAMDPPEGERRLRIRRLFTIATPHRGADLASVPTLDKRVMAMRTGSTFLKTLDEAYPEADYELHPYVRLGDWIVGADNTAPPGDHAWWVRTIPWSPAHIAAQHDPRILADICRRLRGEQPYSLEPRSPLPGSESPREDV
ncbi:MAG: esterase/lipase family protein [Planctomycetota bacterium]|jgi:pimeloyl-ACP methyl ester carboxylesterase